MLKLTKLTSAHGMRDVGGSMCGMSFHHSRHCVFLILCKHKFTDIVMLRCSTMLRGKQDYGSTGSIVQKTSSIVLHFWILFRRYIYQNQSRLTEEILETQFIERDSSSLFKRYACSFTILT